MLFACKGIIAKALYARGLGFEAITAVRALIALPLFWVFAAAREAAQIRRTRPRAIAAAAFAGVLCYYAGAMTDFYALTLIDAGVERVLIFSYPAMVVAIGATRARRWPSRTTVVATLLTYVGIFLVVGGFDLAALRANHVGAGYVLLAALSFAIYFLIGERYTREMGSARFTLFSMTAAAVALGVHVGVRDGLGSVASLEAAGWALLLAISIACMFIPALMQSEGVRRIGAQRAALVSTVGPPTTLFAAWLLLGERMNGWQYAGVALILLGILALDVAKR